MDIVQNSSFPDLEMPSRLRYRPQATEIPYSLYVTDSYCENFAYPLIVYLPEGDQSEQDLWNWFPAISDQNYLGLGVRPPFPHAYGFPGQFHWKMRRPDASMATIRDVVNAACEDWLVNSRRIYLFGEGDGAIVALQHLILQQVSDQDSVLAAGAICRSLPEQWAEWLPHVGDTLRGRLLLLDPIQDADEFAAIDALSEAGIEVTFAHASNAAPPTTVIDHWIMAGIDTAIF